jgi:hypothetical protein
VWKISLQLSGLENINYPPKVADLIYSWVFFSLLLEFVLPSFFGLGVSDPLDVLYYGIGAIVGMIAWRRSTSTEDFKHGEIPNVMNRSNIDETRVFKGF